MTAYWKTMFVTIVDIVTLTLLTSGQALMALCKSDADIVEHGEMPRNVLWQEDTYLMVT